MVLPHRDARLVDATTGAVLGGTDLVERVSAAARDIETLTAGVAFVFMPTAVDAVVRYLGAWQGRRPVALLDPQLAPATTHDYVDRFEPAVVVGVSDEGAADIPDGYRRLERSELGTVWERVVPTPQLTHPDLGILLATSGSTGSPKLVRLSRAAVEANTASIVEALGIGGVDVAISSLPFFYSFGMSVLNSHLWVGATIVIEPGGLAHRPFWTAINEYAVTSLACVPYQYEMLARLRFAPSKYPSLRTLTQAGGRLATDRVRDFHDRIASVGGRLFVMYGQTEAGPRMTTLPADQVTEKVGSVGPAVPGGQLTIRLDDGTETTDPGRKGEVIYRGPNVMMGYAETAPDLALPDELDGMLETGDIGHLDVDGCLYLDGRIKRIGKVFGVRINLDDVEAMIDTDRPAAAVSGEDKIVVWIEGADEDSLAGRAADLAERLHVHWSGIIVRGIDALPLLGNGKVDFLALERLGG